MNSEHQPFLSAYQQAVEQVTALGLIAGLSKPLSHQLTELLQAILTNENTLRQLMESRMNELALLIKQTAQQQQL